MLVVSTPSATTVSGQTVSNRVSLRTNSPACFYQIHQEIEGFGPQHQALFPLPETRALTVQLETAEAPAHTILLPPAEKPYHNFDHFEKNLRKV